MVRGVAIQPTLYDASEADANVTIAQEGTKDWRDVENALTSFNEERLRLQSLIASLGRRQQAFRKATQLSEAVLSIGWACCGPSEMCMLRWVR